MKYYLIDASAFVYAIENITRTKMDFFMEKAKGEAFLYIPQFCVTEVIHMPDFSIEKIKYPTAPKRNHYLPLIF